MAQVSADSTSQIVGLYDICAHSRMLWKDFRIPRPASRSESWGKDGLVKLLALLVAQDCWCSIDIASIIQDVDCEGTRSYDLMQLDCSRTAWAGCPTSKVLSCHGLQVSRQTQDSFFLGPSWKLLLLLLLVLLLLTIIIVIKVSSSLLLLLLQYIITYFSSFIHTI